MKQRSVFVSIIASAIVIAGSVVAYHEYRAQQQEKVEALHCNTCDTRKQQQVQAREKRAEDLVLDNPEQQ